MRFTEHQVKELEDTIINILSSVYIRMEIALQNKKIGEGDVELTIKQIDKVVKYIRGLRPKIFKINTRKGSREL
jgi:hypothetical protein